MDFKQKDARQIQWIYRAIKPSCQTRSSVSSLSSWTQAHKSITRFSEKYASRLSLSCTGILALARVKDRRVVVDSTDALVRGEPNVDSVVDRGNLLQEAWQIDARQQLHAFV